jgi:UDP-N-acetylmuramate dehydrogenase
MVDRGELPSPLSFVGRGTNVLFPDEGFEGTLVRFEQTDPGSGCRWEEGGLVKVGAGFPLPALSREAARRGIHGFEFLACIPGTVGGASVMNAGAGGRTWSDLCQSVTLMTHSGKVLTVPVGDMKYRYRSSVISGRSAPKSALSRERAKDGAEDGKNEGLDNAIVLEAVLRGTPSSVRYCQEVLEKHLQYRKATQPLDEPSLGSVFKNPEKAPEGFSAGRLIEESGLKGVARGGVMVSPRHANFFVNTGEGRASEFLDLLSFVVERVKYRWGIVLEPEVKVWNA